MLSKKDKLCLYLKFGINGYLKINQSPVFRKEYNFSKFRYVGKHLLYWMHQKFRKFFNPACNNPGRFKFGTAWTRKLEVKISYLSWKLSESLKME